MATTTTNPLDGNIMPMPGEAKQVVLHYLESVETQIFDDDELASNCVLNYFGLIARNPHKIKQFLRYNVCTKYSHVGFDEIKACDMRQINALKQRYTLKHKPKKAKNNLLEHTSPTQRAQLELEIPGVSFLDTHGSDISDTEITPDQNNSNHSLDVHAHSELERTPPPSSVKLSTVAPRISAAFKRFTKPPQARYSATTTDTEPEQSSSSSDDDDDDDDDEEQSSDTEAHTTSVEIIEQDEVYPLLYVQTTGELRRKRARSSDSDDDDSDDDEHDDGNNGNDDNPDNEDDKNERFLHAGKVRILLAYRNLEQQPELALIVYESIETIPPRRYIRRRNLMTDLERIVQPPPVLSTSSSSALTSLSAGSVVPHAASFRASPLATTPSLSIVSPPPSPGGGIPSSTALLELQHHHHQTHQCYSRKRHAPSHQKPSSCVERKRKAVRRLRL